MKAFIHKTLIKQTHLVIGLMLCQLIQCEIGRHHTRHITFYRIDDPIIGYPTLYEIIIHPWFISRPALHNEIQPITVISLKFQAMKIIGF